MYYVFPQFNLLEIGVVLHLNRCEFPLPNKESLKWILKVFRKITVWFIIPIPVGLFCFDAYTF